MPTFPLYCGEHHEAHDMMLDAAEIEALLLSLRISAVAVLFALPLAIAAAALLANRRFPGKSIVDGLLHLPQILPPVVVGYLLLVALGTRAPLGAWLLHNLGIRFAFSWTGAALAAGIITFPFQLRAIRLSIEAIDGGLGQAAETLGAGRFDRFLNLTLPLALPGIIAGAITAFAACLGEFGAIITFVSNIPGETRTLPLAIYSALQSPGGEAEAAKLSALSIVLALIGVTLAEFADRRVRVFAGR
ncbi:MAG TPA: molybdate ABC transporter permease subunit [Rhizomicrobium sp.]